MYYGADSRTKLKVKRISECHTETVSTLKFLKILSRSQSLSVSGKVIKTLHRSLRL
jgi:hypothetical protein